MILGLGVSALCAFGALIALVGVVAMALPGRPQPWPVHLMRRGPGPTAAAAAASIYVLALSGALLVIGAGCVTELHARKHARCRQGR
ncbi:hypothetical protein Z951_23820 [Streptomyces sp. PRh5]|uniref:hypothetical protein n=1 Tax=Streptomyces sp. PRh5 TaxID=1158056 RepID=UPI00044541C3|nr:hypothetical protein [Streptomyces sp. PRh5]EXU65736.1 hypothetical protein Z951_23820 [Streptomyces sp. PRh5]